jgi:hypothetical protein
MGKLRKVERRLEKLTAGQVDTVVDSDGRTLAVLMHLNITEQKRVALQLAEANERLTILDHAKAETLNSKVCFSDLDEEFYRYSMMQCF